MTGSDELAHLIGVLRGQRLAIGVDDVPRIAAVLHHTRGWPRERRVRALHALLGRTPAERERLDQIAPLLLVPDRDAAPARGQPAQREAEGQAVAEPSTPEQPALAASRSRRLVGAGGAIAVAALALGLVALWPAPPPPDDTGAAAIDAGRGTGPIAPDRPTAVGGSHSILVAEPSPLPARFRGIAEACGVASLLLIAWSLIAIRARQRRRAAVDRLARSSGRRLVGVAVDRAGVQPIDRATIATLAHMLAAPAPSERETALDPDATVDQTARSAGCLTLCFAREPEQPPVILLEDVSRSMERWPAHASQLARALEIQGQAVERRFIAGDPLQISERRSLDGRTASLEDAAGGFDHEPARTARHARALDRVIWLQPRPGELWGAGARWLNGHAFARSLGTVPGSLAVPTAVAPAWRPPRPCADVDETADAWRSALADDAYLAFAATALLDLATSWTAIAVWALISDGVIAPPWRQLERVWDLPEIAVLPGGRISLAPELRDRLLADVRRQRPELLQGVASWIDARLVAAIDAAGDGSLGAAVGEVYLDRVARAAGRDGSGPRVRRLARNGLAAVVAAHVGGDERATWRIRDPHTAVTARLRGPLLGLTLLAMAGFAAGSAVAPVQRDVEHSVPLDAGLVDSPDAIAIDALPDAPPDARPGDPERGARVAERAGCLGCHSDARSRDWLGPSFAGMWGSAVALANDRSERPVKRIVDDQYVRDKLAYPRQTLHLGYPAVHVSYADTLGDAEIADLIAYLRSLAKQRPPRPRDPAILADRPRVGQPAKKDAKKRQPATKDWLLNPPPAPPPPDDTGDKASAKK